MRLHRVLTALAGLATALLLFAGVLPVASAGAQAAPGTGATVSGPTLAAPASVSNVTGPDVSAWNHPGGAAIDWNQVAASGQSFAIIKATEGEDYVTQDLCIQLLKAEEEHLVLFKGFLKEYAQV